MQSLGTDPWGLRASPQKDDKRPSKRGRKSLDSESEAEPDQPEKPAAKQDLDANAGKKSSGSSKQAKRKADRKSEEASQTGGGKRKAALAKAAKKKATVAEIAAQKGTVKESAEIEEDSLAIAAAAADQSEELPKAGGNDEALLNLSQAPFLPRLTNLATE